MRAGKVVRRRSSGPERPPVVVVRPEELPEDLALERKLIATLTLYPSETVRRVRALVEPADFAAPYHEAIWRCALELEARGVAPEWVPICDLLRQKGEGDKLRAVGGDLYYLQIADAANHPQFIDYTAEQIAARAHARRLTYAAAEIAARGRRGEDPIAFAEEARALFDEAAGTRPAAAWPAWRDLVETVGYSGPRLVTGIESIDAPIGGLPRGVVVVLGGAPGAGKTGLAVQWLRRWALEGIPTAMVCADQPAHRILVRWGQMDGIERGALERRDPDALAELRERRPDVPPLLVDSTKRPISLQAVSAELRRRREATKAPISVLVADSLQTLEAGAPDDADARQRVEVAVRATLHAAEVDGHVVVVTCELTKGAYRKKNQAENDDDLAAFADSRATLHAADLAFVLRTPEAGGLIRVTSPKSRLGGVKPFSLDHDHGRARMEEVEPDRTEEADEDQRRADALEAMKARILKAIRAAPQPLRTKDELVRRLGARRKAVLDALAELVDRREVLDSARGFTLPDPPQE